MGLFFKQQPSANLSDQSVDFNHHLKVYQNKLTEVIELLNYHLRLTIMNSSQLINYINYCITGEYINLILPQKSGIFLKHFLATKDLVGGDNPKIGDTYLRAITIMGFPATSYAGILDKLNYLGFEYRFNTRFIPVDQFEGKKIIDRLADLWYQKRVSPVDTVKISMAIESNIKINHNAEKQYQDAQDALSLNDSNNVKFGFYTATIILLDESLETIETNAKEVRSILRNMGFQSQIERYHGIEAYLGSLPGYVYANIRKWLIHTQNVADLMPNTAVWSGLNYNPCKLYPKNSPVLFYADTTGNTPVKLSLHVNDNGHTLILGPTGSGKSTLLNFIIVQHFRYKDAQVFMFDKNRSSLPLCLGLGGEFFDIGSAEINTNSYFQPLANLEQEADFEFANIWLEELCVLNGMATNFNDTHRNAIRKALMLMRSETPVNRRNISYFRYLVHDYDQIVASVLDGFSSELSNNELFSQTMGFIAKLFDATVDKLSNNNCFTVFEMAKLIELGDRIVIPALRYFIYKINQRVMENKPTLIIFDESFIFFKHEIFRSKIIEWLKTMRKFNVAIVFATQEIEDLFKYSDLLSSLKNNCATKIYLPNGKALSLGICNKYQDMGLNDKQINLLTKMVIGEYFYTSELGIRKFNLHLKVNQLTYAFTARTSNNDINHAIDIYNNNPNKFISNWYEYSKSII